MYEVCKSFHGRRDPTFGDNCLDPFDPQTGLRLPVNSETENLILDQPSTIEFSNLARKVAVLILFAAPLYAAYLYFDKQRAPEALAKFQTQNDLNQGLTTQFRKIDLTTTASIKPAEIDKDISSGTKLDIPIEIFYTIKSGDTLSQIGRVYNVRVSDIMELNEIADARSIKPGMKLTISKPN